MPYDIEDVFYPGRVAKGDIEFRARTIETERLERSLDHHRSNQPVVVGPSGVGKTSLVHHVFNKLKRPFISVDMGGYANRSQKELTLQVLSTIALQYLPYPLECHNRLGAVYTHVTNYPTIQNLVAFLSELDRPTVLDDCDDIGPEGIQWLMTLLRVAFNHCAASSNKVKIISILALEGEFLSSLEPSVINKIDRHEIQGLTNVDMCQITRSGFDRLGLTYTPYSIGWIHHKCCGIPREVHQLCFEISSQALANKPSGRLSEKIDQYLQSAIRSLGSNDSLNYDVIHLKSRLEKLSMQYNIEHKSLLSVCYLHQAYFAKPPTLKELAKEAELNIDKVVDMFNALLTEGFVAHLGGNGAGAMYDFTRLTDRRSLRYFSGISDVVVFKTNEQFYKAMECFAGYDY